MITAKPWSGHPKEHLTRQLSEYTLHFSTGSDRLAVNVTATRVIAKSERQTTEERLQGAFSSCMFEIERKIRGIFHEGQELHLWVPEEFWWQTLPETVDDPVRMFIAHDPAEDAHFLCVALTVTAVEFKAIEILVNTGHIDADTSIPCPVAESAAQ